MGFLFFEDWEGVEILVELYGKLFVNLKSKGDLGIKDVRVVKVSLLDKWRLNLI